MTRPSRSGRFHWPDPSDDAENHWHQTTYAAACRDCGAVVWPDFEEAHDTWHDKIEDLKVIREYNT